MSQPDPKPPKIFTNSCIELSIPFQYQQSGNLSCNWTSTPFPQHHQSPLAHFLTSQHKAARSLDRTYYLCTPLDVGCKVGVRVEMQVGGQQGVVLEELVYGPVEVQAGLLGGLQGVQWNHVEILLNKNVKKSGVVSVDHELKSNKKNHPHSNTNPITPPPGPSLTITIKISNTEFHLPLSQQIARTQLESFQKSPFFKIYDSEPNTVGIFISYRMAQFMEKLKQLNIYNHFGSYLKLAFESRVCRDVFMLSVMWYGEVGVEGLREFGRQLAVFEGEKVRSVPVVTAMESNKTALRQMIKIPKIQSIVRASQIMGTEFQSASSAQSQVKPQQDILEDIYNILNTPVQKIKRQSIKKQLQSEQKQGNIISSAFDIDEKSIQINDEEYAAQVESQRKSGSKGQTSEEKGEISHNNGQRMEKRRLYKKHKTLDIQERQFKEQPNKNFRHSKKQTKNNGITNTQHHNFQQQIKQINLLQKIDELTHKNQELQAQNMRLKLQNQRLKSDESKHQKIKELNKMIQIKAMVQMMARKLEHLESNEGMTTPRHFMDKSRNTQKKDGSIHQIQGNKRLWSPRAHRELIKTIKQKNIEDKIPFSKNEIPRKKSATNIITHNHEDSTFKIIRKDSSQSKQCLSFGKNNHFNPINYQEPVEQRIKIAKPELFQTHELSQLTKNYKEALYTSTKEFSSPLDFHRGVQQPQQRTPQLFSSTSQPAFRNVFGE